MTVLAVIADTHIPDRARQLHPAILPLFQAAGASQILHAGDISTPAVLRELETVAPVTAVRGNRDWAFHKLLPWQRLLDVEGVPVALMHGHGNWWSYLWDKWQFLLFNYQLKRYLPMIEKPYPQAKVLIFGHTHQPVNEWRHGRLLFNPGSAGVQFPGQLEPSVGLLRVEKDGTIQGEIVPLTGYRLVRGEWRDNHGG
jgi:putative phosphoesterase